MRFPLLVVLSASFVVSAQEGEREEGQSAEEQRKIPTRHCRSPCGTGAHLSAEVLSELSYAPLRRPYGPISDGIGPEYWKWGRGLWRGGLLAQRLQEWGFTDPTYCVKSDSRGFGGAPTAGFASGRAPSAAKPWRSRKEERGAVQQAKAMIPGPRLLRFEKRAVPVERSRARRTGRVLHVSLSRRRVSGRPLPSALRPLSLTDTCRPFAFTMCVSDR